MWSKLPTILVMLGAALLVAIAALHLSGYPWVATSIVESDLSEFLKSILPTMFVYPSAMMAVLAVVSLTSVRHAGARTFVLLVVATIILGNAVLGFVLGGAVPGLVLIFVAGLFSAAALLYQGLEV